MNKTAGEVKATSVENQKLELHAVICRGLQVAVTH